jgi:hypothetical protein
MYLIETLFRGDAIELKYEDRGERVVLIATLFELERYLIEHATELKEKAIECKARGLSSQILK